MTQKQIKELCEIYFEISDAMDYVSENSPASFAIAVPLASMCTFITDECGLTRKQVEKLLGIKFIKQSLKGQA
jgi:hypothetical protein